MKLAFFLFAGLFGAAAAAQVAVLDPATWYASPETILVAASLIVPFITKILTALGKDWFKTEGRATQWLSLGVAVVIAGVGGFLSLGFLAGVSGVQGLFQAIFLVVVAFLGSNGMAKSERQAAASAYKHYAKKE